MKKTKILFWVATALIFIFEGVMPAFTSQSEMSIQGFTHLGYPIYFVSILTVFKVLGAIVLIIPRISSTAKEWAYAGFTFDFICAFLSLWAVDGVTNMLWLPVVALMILVVSYTNYHKMMQAKINS